MIKLINALQEILERDPRELLGQPETSWLDFKREPYAIDDSMGGHRVARFELAKDVSVFASGGGAIVLGVETEKDTHEQVEVATGLRPIAAGCVNRDQLQKVIWEWVYPRLDVVISSHAIPDVDPAKRLWSIIVPKQSKNDQPFIVARSFGDDGRRDKRIAFSVFDRASTDNAPYSTEQIHRWIRDGRRWTDSKDGVTYADTASAESVLQEDLNALGHDAGRAIYYLQAMPSEPVALDQFYIGASNSMYEALTRIDHLRPNGFNLPDGIRPEQTPNGGWRVSTRGGDSLSITRGGCLTAVQGEEHLTWATDKHAGEGERWINNLALVEFTLEFWRFYESGGRAGAKHARQCLACWRCWTTAASAPLSGVLPASLRPSSSSW